MVLVMQSEKCGVKIYLTLVLQGLNTLVNKTHPSCRRAARRRIGGECSWRWRRRAPLVWTGAPSARPRGPSPKRSGPFCWLLSECPRSVPAIQQTASACCRADGTRAGRRRAVWRTGGSHGDRIRARIATAPSPPAPRTRAARSSRHCRSCHLKPDRPSRRTRSGVDTVYQKEERALRVPSPQL